MKERKLHLSVTYVYLDVQAYDFFSKRSRLHDRNVDGIFFFFFFLIFNVDGINAISAWIRLQTRQAFNQKVKGKWKGE